jgi:hypothetical protein
MKYDVKMGSGAMIYISSFIKFGSYFQKFVGRIHRQNDDNISLVLFFQNNEIKLKLKYRFILTLWLKLSICMSIFR